jgi:hypothetical protein
MGFIVIYPVWSAAAIWAVTLIMGGALVLGADFGLSIWIVIPALTWLATAGLPATTGVVLMASVWGVVPGLHGLGAFLCCGALLGLALEIVCCVCLSRWWRRRVSS